jgi:hypothetical protein
MHVVRHYYERNHRDACSVEMPQRERDFLSTSLATQNAGPVSGIEPLLETA